MTTPSITTLCGLGNPGEDYKNHRHNIGFMLIDHLCKTYQSSHHKKHNCLIYNTEIENTPLHMVTPQNYMNNSGTCLKKWLSSTTYTPKQCLIIYDDVDIPFGEIRLREKGSAGTHNGLKDIVSQLNTTHIPRLRIGIKPNHPIHDLSAFVLSPFKKSELNDIPFIHDQCQKIIETLMIKNIPDTMSLHNGWSLNPKS